LQHGGSRWCGSPGGAVEPLGGVKAIGAFGAFGVIGAFGLIGLIGPKGRRLTPSGHTAQAQAEQQRMDDQ
jgi:hypothetical protein